MSSTVPLPPREPVLGGSTLQQCVTVTGSLTAERELTLFETPKNFDRDEIRGSWSSKTTGSIPSEAELVTGLRGGKQGGEGSAENSSEASARRLW